MKSAGRETDIRCPVCASTERVVTDSRSKPNGGDPFIRRRIRCGNGHGYTTYERPAWAWTQEEDKRRVIDELKALVKRL